MQQVAALNCIELQPHTIAPEKQGDLRDVATECELIQISPRRPEGFEPPTVGSEDRCSIQLSYGRDMAILAASRGPAQGCCRARTIKLMAPHLSRRSEGRVESGPRFDCFSSRTRAGWTSTKAMLKSLCEDCQRMREVITAKGSRFLLCELSRTDSDYPKYPPQPVMRCDGHQPNHRTPENKE